MCTVCLVLGVYVFESLFHVSFKFALLLSLVFQYSVVSSLWDLWDTLKCNLQIKVQFHRMNQVSRKKLNRSNWYLCERKLDYVKLRIGIFLEKGIHCLPMRTHTEAWEKDYITVYVLQILWSQIKWSSTAKAENSVFGGKLETDLRSRVLLFKLCNMNFK